MVPPANPGSRIGVKSLALILAGGLVVVLSLQIWLLAVSHQRTVEVFRVRAANRSQANANQVNAVFRQIDLIMLDVRGHVPVDAVLGGPAAATAPLYAAMRTLMLERIARLPRLLNLHVVDREGRYVFSSGERQPQVGIADRAYFLDQAAARTDRLVVSPPLLGRIINRYAIFCSRRLCAPDGSFAGIVMATIDAEGLSEELRAVDQSAWSQSLVSTGGVLAARQPQLRDLVGAEVDPAVRAWMAGQQPTWIGAGLGEARPHVWGIAAVGDLPLYAITGYPLDLALGQWRRDLHAHLAAALLLMLGGAVVLALATRREHALERAGDLDRRLRSSELALSDLASRVPVGVFRLAMRVGRPAVDYASPRCTELLGGLPADADSLYAMVAPDDRPRLREAITAAARGRSFAWSGRLSGSAGERWLDVEASMLETPEGRQWNGVVQDVTERRRLEMQLRQSEKMQAIGLLAGGIAHDFNNILAGIGGFAELARRRRPPEPVAGHLAQIAAGADRAKTLVQQILTFSRRGPSERVPVHLQSTVREVVNLLRATIPASVEMQVDLAQDVPPVLADPGRIHQLVMNLCSNAVHAMRGSGRLGITLARTVQAEAATGGRMRALPAGSYACLTVSDSGCGMDAATLQRIFEPFFSTKGQEGTGLGLAVVWGVVDTHDGDISVESRPGAGTSFRVLLPAVAVPAAAPARAAASLPTGGSERVLVVDDEPSLRGMMAEALGDLGYSVTTCGSAAEALRLLRDPSAACDLVITDQTMPGASGRELAEELARERPGLPVILCSGLEVPGHADGPTRRFIAKPADLQALAVLMRRLLDRSA